MWGFVGKSIKRVLPHSLMGRSLLILIVPILLIQMVTAYLFIDRHWTRVTSRLAGAVAGEIAILVDTLDSDGGLSPQWSFIQQKMDGLELQSRHVIGGALPAQVSTGRGILWNTLVTQKLKQELKKKIHFPFIVVSDIKEKWIMVLVQMPDGLLEIRLPSSRLFSSSSYIFLLWMVAISGLLLLMAVMFMRNQVRPIRRLAVAADRFGKGRDIGSFRPSGAIEVRQAAQAFLSMQERIKRQIEQRTTMLAGVSHDLRTPLTRLKLQLEMLAQGEDVQAMKADIADMERMIGAYLDFVRGDGDEEVQAVDIGALLEKTAGQAQRQGTTLDYTPPAQAILVQGRPLALERALSNILDNAGKYADAAWISVKQTDFNGARGVEITVEDNGPGIPVENRMDVFKPFYRLEKSRNAKTGGVGLGLSISSDIIHGHGGQIELLESSKGGLCVRINLPE